MIPKLISAFLAGDQIEPPALEDALHAIMEGNVSDAQIAGLLVAMAGQPLQAPLLAAAARALRAHRVAVHPQVRPLVDTCGTGGDGAGTFNISTAAAMVVASAGAAVAKHGNRGVSSRVGSADVLEAVGCTLAVSPDGARDLLDATGFVFLFAPAFHPAMKHVGPVRKSLRIRTLFNVLGPLANPALAEFQLVGVYEPALTRVMAETLRELGGKSALVVHCSGLDEIGLHAPTEGHRLVDGRIESFRLDPADIGVQGAPISSLQGGEPDENAALLRTALAGEPGPHADIVALNAAAALEVAGKVPDLRQGLELARERMSSGQALAVLERYAESSGRMGGSV
jgi:anthranilate phosphoribosyltransferase